MKIAIFSDSFYPELSGITDSITLLGKALSARGHSILYVVPKYSNRNYGSTRLDRKEPNIGNNISIKRMPSIMWLHSPNGQGRIALPIGSSIFALKAFRPDVIHVQTPYGPGIESLIASKILKIPLVGTNHTPVSEFMRGAPGLFTKTALRYNSWFYNRCLFVSAPCRSLLDEMESYGLKVECNPIANPTDTTNFFPPKDGAEKANLKKRFGLSPFCVLYTGRLAPEKGVDVVVKAVAKAREKAGDISFAVTGRGVSEKQLRNLAIKLGIEKEVKFFGFVNDQDFPLLYRASDLFVIMSTAESQSLSLMDAMSTGLPVIGARARALPEYISSESGFVVSPGDVEELSKIILKIHDDSPLAQKLGNGGREAVKKYEPPFIARMWEKVYADAIVLYRKIHGIS